MGRVGQLAGGLPPGGAEALVGRFAGQARAAALPFAQAGRLAVHGHVHQNVGHAIGGGAAGRGGGQGGDGDLCCFFHGIGSSVEFLNRQGMVFYGKMKGNQPVVEVLLCLSM